MRNLKSIVLAGMIGVGSLAGFNGYGQTDTSYLYYGEDKLSGVYIPKNKQDSLNFQNEDYSSEYKQIDIWMQKLYKKDPIGFENTCYTFLNEKIKETNGEISYYKSIKNPDMAEIEHLKDNKKLFMALNKYSCKSFKTKKN